jgi:hypothetical protein
MKILLISAALAVALVSGLPAGAQQPPTPLQPNTPYTVQPMPPVYAPPRHVTRQRYRRARVGYPRRGYYPPPGYYLSAHQLPSVYYPRPW